MLFLVSTDMPPLMLLRLCGQKGLPVKHRLASPPIGPLPPFAIITGHMKPLTHKVQRRPHVALGVATSAKDPAKR